MVLIVEEKSDAMRPSAASRVSRISPRWLAGAAALAAAVTLVPVAALAATALPATTSASATARTAATPACATSGLVIWLTSNGVAAGTAFYTLNFTNESGHACTLEGHPGVAAASLAGRQIGAPAGWQPPAAHVVRLANDATAYALVSYSDVIVGGSGPRPCDAVTSAGLRVFPPGQKASKVVPLPLAACTRKDVVYMKVEPVQKNQPANNSARH
jgi:Protein of unknown function (DUF4232)